MWDILRIWNICYLIYLNCILHKVMIKFLQVSWEGGPPKFVHKEKYQCCLLNTAKAGTKVSFGVTKAVACTVASTCGRNAQAL